jgi:hypothetical protein
MKTFIIIGRQFTWKHGYLATRGRWEIEAKNKTAALKQAKLEAREGSSSCNRFEVQEPEDLVYSAEEAQLEREYWDQDPLGEGNPEIKPHQY